MRTHRYRPPVRIPLRDLVVAACSATVGSFEVILGVGLGLPRFVVQAGIVLIVVAVIISLWCWRRYRSLQWTLALHPGGVDVIRPGGSTTLPWVELNSVHLTRSRVEFWDRRGRRVAALPVDPRDNRAAPLIDLIHTLQERLG